MPAGKRGKSGLRLWVPSGAVRYGSQRDRTCLRQPAVGVEVSMVLDFAAGFRRLSRCTHSPGNHAKAEDVRGG